MKIRSGFVSNSSSSSFIIGVAEILDEEKVREYLKDNEGWMYKELEIIKTDELDFTVNEDGTTTKVSKNCEVQKVIYDDGEELIVWIKAPTNNEENCSGVVDEPKGKTLIVARIGNNEDDGPFLRDDGFCGLDYSVVNEEYFKNNFPDPYKVLELLKGKEGVTKTVAFKYGVSRCG
jgi:hypothetical protein